MELTSETTKFNILIKPDKGLFHLDLFAVWQCRGLLYFLVWRDIKVRYKQAAIGIGWVILQPIITMLIFTVIFGKFARFPSEGIPYSVFALTAILPWTYFSQSLNRAGNSLVGEATLLSKVYFPRLILILSAVIAPLLDLLISSFLLLGMMALYGVIPTFGVLALPFFLLMAIMLAVALGLWLAPLNVRYRDIGHIIPFVILVWMYASPVIYPMSIVPEKYRLIYSLNPMVGVIEGFRWALLGTASPDFTAMGMSGLFILILFFSGVIFFKYMEKTFADVV